MVLTSPLHRWHCRLPCPARPRRHRGVTLISHLLLDQPTLRGGAAGRRLGCGCSGARVGVLDDTCRRSTRVETSILRKMLRRWVSTVFWLRTRSPAICGLVLRSTTSRATWSSRSVSESMRVPSVWPACVRRWRAGGPSFLALAPRCRVAQRADASNAAAARWSSATARSLWPAWPSARPASVRESALSI